MRRQAILDQWLVIGLAVVIVAGAVATLCAVVPRDSFMPMSAEDCASMMHLPSVADVLTPSRTAGPYTTGTVATIGALMAVLLVGSGSLLPRSVPLISRDPISLSGRLRV